MEYHIVWSIDLDADTHEDAARVALEIQRDPESLAGHVTVIDEDGNKQEIWAEHPPP